MESKYTEEQFVKALKGQKWNWSVTERTLDIGRGISIEIADVYSNLDAYIQACVSLFREPAHIHEKVETFSGYYRIWNPCNTPDEIKDKTIKAMSDNKEAIKQGLENMSMHGLPHHRTSGLDHEISNMTYLIGESGLRRDKDVLRTLWNKVKMTPNGYLDIDEFKLFIQYTMGTAEGYQALEDLTQVRTGLVQGKGVPEALYLLITDLKLCKKWHEKYFGQHEEKSDLESALRQVEESLESSKKVIQIVDKALEAR